MLASFFRGTAKLAAAIVLAGVVLAALGFAWVRISDGMREREAAPYEVVKTWNSDVGELLGMKMIAKTKLVHWRIFADVNFEGYPAYLGDPVMGVRNADNTISVAFADKDGFKVFERPITLREFNRLLDAKGQPKGLEFEFSEPMLLADYARFNRVNVSWNVDTKAIPPMEPSPGIAAAPLADHCAPNLSRAERLRRLGQHGKVRETGLETYSAGGRSVSFMYGGSSTVLSCN